MYVHDSDCVAWLWRRDARRGEQQAIQDFTLIFQLKYYIFAIAFYDIPTHIVLGFGWLQQPYTTLLTPLCSNHASTDVERSYLVLFFRPFPRMNIHKFPLLLLVEQLCMNVATVHIREMSWAVADAVSPYQWNYFIEYIQMAFGKSTLAPLPSRSWFSPAMHCTQTHHNACIVWFRATASRFEQIK